MITLYNQGAYLINGLELVEDTKDAKAVIAAKTGKTISKEEADRKQDTNDRSCITNVR